MCAIGICIYSSNVTIRVLMLVLSKNKKQGCTASFYT